MIIILIEHINDKELVFVVMASPLAFPMEDQPKMICQARTDKKGTVLEKLVIRIAKR
jgi:hypothetical protein